MDWMERCFDGLDRLRASRHNEILRLTTSRHDQLQYPIASPRPSTKQRAEYTQAHRATDDVWQLRFSSHEPFIA